MVGIDITSIERIDRIFRQYGMDFLEHFLSAQEIKILESKNLNVASMAGFWAAKEACSKALGVGIGKDLSFLDIITSYTPKKAPLITLTQHKLEKFHINNLALSISHDGGFAIAIVIASFV